MTEAQEKAAVRRGVALLDRFEPKWFKKINPATFGLRDSNQCALGQVYGEYFKGLQTLASKAVTKVMKAHGIRLEDVIENVTVDPEYYGFNSDGSNISFERMGQQWLRAAARRSKG